MGFQKTRGEGLLEEEEEVNESAIFSEGEWSWKLDRSNNLLAQGLSITTAQQMRLEQSCGGGRA